MQTSNTILSFAVLSSLLLLSGCSNTPQNNVQTQAPATITTPTVAEEESKRAPLEEMEVIEETENEAELAMPAEDPMLTDTSEYSLSTIQALTDKFKYNQDSNFLNCSHSAVVNCQREAATQISLESKNANACDEIMDEAQTIECKNSLWNQLALVEKKPSLCDNLEEYLQDSCKNQASFALATESQDITKCEDINDIYQQDSCKNQININKAITALDPALCEAVITYNYETVYPEVDPTDDALNNDPTEVEFEIIRTPVSQEENFERQNCLDQIEMNRSIIEEEAAILAEQEATNQTEEPVVE